MRNSRAQKLVEESSTRRSVLSSHQPSSTATARKKPSIAMIVLSLAGRRSVGCITRRYIESVVASANENGMRGENNFEGFGAISHIRAGGREGRAPGGAPRARRGRARVAGRQNYGRPRFL